MRNRPRARAARRATDADRGAYAGGMNDADVAGHIEALVAEEHRLLESAVGHEPPPDQHQRLEQVRVELDRYWDLLRQRRAREEFGLDPGWVGLRDEQTVEGFEQ